jgi:hypothetical protein
MQQVQDQFAQNFAQRIIDRYELPQNIHVSMKNAETLVFKVSGGAEMDNLLNQCLSNMVQAATDWGTRFIYVDRLDDPRRSLKLKTDSCKILLEKIN